MAAGGFAAPYGYGRVPEVAWKVELQLDAGAAGWVPLPKANAKITRKRLVVAAPSRTARHAQAAVHTLWPKGTLDERRERMVFYGFRKVDGLWTLKANSRKD